MATFEKKPTDAASGLKAVGDTLAKLEGDVANMRRHVQLEAEQAAALTEQRKRETEQYEYTTKMERLQKLDESARLDAQHEERLAKRLAEAKAREDALCNLLSIPWSDGPVGAKAIETAFNARLEATAKAAEGKATAIAQKQADQDKALADAQAKTELELLKQRNTQLAVENGELKAQNAKLLDASSGTINKMQELATEGFKAAGAINGRGQASLETAAAGAGYGSPRPRG